MTAEINWVVVGQSLFLVCIGMLGAWNARRAAKTAKTVDTVHALVNSAMTLQKKSLAEVTAAKAELTKNSLSGPADRKAAELAMIDYLDHVQKQSKVDDKNTP